MGAENQTQREYAESENQYVVHVPMQIRAWFYMNIHSWDKPPKFFQYCSATLGFLGVSKPSNSRPSHYGSKAKGCSNTAILSITKTLLLDNAIISPWAWKKFRIAYQYLKMVYLKNHSRHVGSRLKEPHTGYSASETKKERPLRTPRDDDQLN